MDCELLASSESSSDGMPQALSFTKTMLHHLRLQQASIPSWSSRQLRYIVIAIILLAIWTMLLPFHSTASPQHENHSLLRIQFAFGKESSTAKSVRLSRQKRSAKHLSMLGKGIKTTHGFTMKPCHYQAETRTPSLAGLQH